MITLGIETSCDETAVALLSGKKIIAEEVASSARDHSPYGGVVPEIASRRHLESLLPCLDAVLRRSSVKLSRIDLVAVTQGPGLVGSLLVGVSAAKSLALSLNKPLVGVDHVLAHAYSGQALQKKDLFPFMALVVSGGHTVLIWWERLESFRIIGRTFDDAAGEAFDKVAKMMDLGYPGGPVIDRISRGVDGAKYAFPRPWISAKHYHFSFSGLKTAVLYTLRDIEKRRHVLNARDKAEIASAFQEAATDVLVAKAMRACADYRSKTLVVGGGVSANTRLCGKFRAAGKKKGVKIFLPPLRFAVDNAAMIALLGHTMFCHAGKEGRKSARGGRFSPDFKVYADFFEKPKGVKVSLVPRARFS